MARELSRVGKSVEAYLKRYDAAHAIFAARLSEAQKEAEEQKKWEQVMVGIIIGTGVGLVAGELYAATALVSKIIYEVAGEGAEAVVGQVLGDPPTNDFTPPPELNNDKVARGHLEKLLEAWRGLALLQAAAIKFIPVRDAQRGATKVTNIEGKLQHLSVALANTDAALNRFLTTVDTPVLSHDQLTI